MPGRKLVVAVVATVVLGLVGAGSLIAANKAKPKNGGFETGNLNRWKQNDSSSGEWVVYSGTTLPPASGPVLRGVPSEPFFAPPQKTFAAATIVGEPGTRILHRPLKLKQGRQHKLKLWVYYDNNAGEFFSPETLDFEGEDNQQYRIDVMKKSAPLDSVEEEDILKEVFGTQPGDPVELAPKKVRVNLTKFAGKKVRLRFAEVDNQQVFNAAVDGVKLKSKPKK